jgi:peptide/nickel transport system permease protein
MKFSVQAKLKRNKIAMASMTIIFIAILVAVFAYFISPDGSPNSNRMIPEIANKRPGYNAVFLLLKPSLPASATSFLHRLLYGKNDEFTYIPITGYTKNKDSIVVEKYIDDGVSTKAAYHLQQLPKEFIRHQKFYLGTDRFGRDILSRLIIGTRVSLGVGLVAVIISLTVGILLGAIAGYFKGFADDVITWFINVIWSIPTLLLAFAITLVLGKGFWQVFIAVGFTLWVSVARLVRGQVLAVSQLEYVEAARALGFGRIRIIVKHILPNIMGPVMVIAAGNFASAIVIEAGLSFLGIGVQPPQPSWGLMIKENYNFIITHNPAIALIPGVAIMLLVLAFNLLGNALRDAMDTKSIMVNG